MTKFKIELEIEVRTDFDIQEPGGTSTPEIAYRRLQEQLSQLANRREALLRVGFCLVSMKRVP